MHHHVARVANALTALAIPVSERDNRREATMFKAYLYNSRAALLSPRKGDAVDVLEAPTIDELRALIAEKWVHMLEAGDYIKIVSGE
jgi:hypothetical protein